MPAERLAGKQPEIGPAAPTWERWRLAGVFRGETFSHPLAAGTAALPGLQPSSGCSLIVCQRHNPGALNSMRFGTPKEHGKLLYTGVVNN
jgi:hypothetical protein